MSLQEQFNQAQIDSKNLPERPDNMTLLKIYALFKQGSTGDATGDRPAAPKAATDGGQATAGASGDLGGE